jgi:hypothetical protein
LRSAFSAAASGRILLSLDALNTVSRARLLDRRDARNRNAGSAGTACAHQPLRFFQTPGAEIGLQQGEFKTGKGASASIVASNSGRTNAAKPRASAGGYPAN